METQRVQMNGVLPSLGLYRYKTFLFCLGCSSRPSTKHVFLAVHYFNSFFPHRPASMAASRAGSPVSIVSLNRRKSIQPISWFAWCLLTVLLVNYFLVGTLAQVCVKCGAGWPNEAEGYRAGPTRRPAWLAGGEWHSRVWFCTWWMVHAACPDGPYHLPRSGAAQLQASGNSSCCCCWSITKCTQIPTWWKSWKSHMARRVISLGWPTHLRQPADQEY